MLAVSDVRVEGERLEGRGVMPDVVVPFRLPYAAGHARSSTPRSKSWRRSLDPAGFEEIAAGREPRRRKVELGSIQSGSVPSWMNRAVLPSGTRPSSSRTLSQSSGMKGSLACVGQVWPPALYSARAEHAVLVEQYDE